VKMLRYCSSWLTIKERYRRLCSFLEPDRTGALHRRRLCSQFHRDDRHPSDSDPHIPIQKPLDPLPLLLQTDLDSVRALHIAHSLVDRCCQGITSPLQSRFSRTKERRRRTDHDLYSRNVVLGMRNIHRLNRIGRCERTSERESESIGGGLVQEEQPPFEVG
jgi:hypothetical protein